jgi:hypothetical protein
MKIYLRSRVLRPPKKINPEAELWFQSLMQLEHQILNRRNDPEFQKFCCRCVNFFRNDQHWLQELFLQSVLKQVEPFKNLCLKGL